MVRVGIRFRVNSFRDSFSDLYITTHTSLLNHVADSDSRNDKHV